MTAVSVRRDYMVMVARRMPDQRPLRLAPSSCSLPTLARRTNTALPCAPRGWFATPEASSARMAARRLS
jgi:hypothetical protein